MTPNLLPPQKVVKDKAAQFTQYVLTRLQDGRWHTTAALCDNVQGLDDRTVREIAERAEGSVISSQKGYRLTVCATWDEVRRSSQALKSQATKMVARANKQMYVKSCCRG